MLCVFYFTADVAPRSLSVGIVVGIVAAIVFVIILILVIIWWRGCFGWRDTRSQGICLQRNFYCFLDMYLSRKIQSYAYLTHSSLFGGGRGNYNSSFILGLMTQLTLYYLEVNCYYSFTCEPHGNSCYQKFLIVALDSTFMQT